jgi:hypothetical protein
MGNAGARQDLQGGNAGSGQNLQVGVAGASKLARHYGCGMFGPT